MSADVTRPSPAPLGHPLPRGEREVDVPSELPSEKPMIRPLSQVAQEQQERARQVQSLPSPLAGEGVSRRLTGEGSQLQFAKHLRLNMTDAETRLWKALRAKRFENYKFRRQVPIGNFIVDFVCFQQRLIVEVDGSQHEGSAHDARRDVWLKVQGFRVLKFWNVDVLKELDGVLIAILEGLRARPSPAPSGHPLPLGEREGGAR